MSAIHSQQLFWVRKEEFLRNISINSGFSSLEQNTNLAEAGLWILLPSIRDVWSLLQLRLSGLGSRVSMSLLGQLGLWGYWACC